jgi:hypothetical protein
MPGYVYCQQLVIEGESIKILLYSLRRDAGIGIYAQRIYNCPLSRSSTNIII